jgi:hypothetical protein
MGETVMSVQAPFDGSVMAPLRRLARRVRLFALIEGLSVLLAIWVVLTIAQYLLDRLLRLEVSARASLLVLVVAVMAYAAWRRVLRPLARQVSVDSVASMVERRHPRLADRLISAVQFARGEGAGPSFNSPVLVASLLDRTVNDFSAAALVGLLNLSRMLRFALLSALMMAFVAAASAMDRSGLAIFVSRNYLLSSTPWPSRTQLEVVGFRGNVLRWPLGDPLSIVVRAHGERPRWGIRMMYETADGFRGERPMPAVGDGQYRLDYGELESSLQLMFVMRRFGVNERSEPYRIEAVERPAVRAMTVTVSPPTYTRLEPYNWAPGQTSGEVLLGSSIRLVAELNKEVVSARLARGGRSLVDAVSLRPMRWMAEFVPDESGSYGFELEDNEGLRDARPVTCSIRLIHDRPPKVRLRLPGTGELIVSQAVPRIVAEFEDNLGLATAELVYRVDRGGESASGSTSDDGDTEGATQSTGNEPPGGSAMLQGVLRLTGFEPYQMRFEHDRPWELSGLGLEPGDRLTLYCRATDFRISADRRRETMDAQLKDEDVSGDPFGMPADNEGRSTVFTLRIVTTEELLAELARRETEWRQEFEQILRLQEKIRDDLTAQAQSLRDTSLTFDEARRLYGEIERQQRSAGVRLRTVRRQFQDILDELEINRQATRPVRRRLEGGVIGPMGRLVETEIPNAARLIQQLHSQFDDETADLLNQIEDQIVGIMRDILTHMLKWEGFNEAVGLLREVLKLQEEINRKTREELDRQIEELFGKPAATQPVER